MAYYLVNANIRTDTLDELKARLDSAEIKAMRPFGPTLDYALKHARITTDGQAVWEEEDYCRPPLAMERAAILDTYFTNLRVEMVNKGEGWQQIDDLRRLWS
ncbi:MAG: hypothetical protein KDJ52_05675 [Anaerolineae bacterium]|nr:hypothetical protein [Anaerolineae bacterium]